MAGKSTNILMTIPLAKKLPWTLVVFSALISACGPGAGGEISVTPEVEGEAGGTSLPVSSATATISVAAVVASEQWGFCFTVPEGFTQVPGIELVEVMGPYAGSGPEPGLMWVDVTEAEGRSAEEVANEEVAAVGGLNPPRYTVTLGGEEALVLDGMPGQDAVRKVYIVHAGKLYRLSFSPYRSDNVTANDQMEALYAAVTSSWVWISSGQACTAGG